MKKEQVPESVDIDSNASKPTIDSIIKEAAVPEHVPLKDPQGLKKKNGN